MWRNKRWGLADPTSEERGAKRARLVRTLEQCCRRRPQLVTSTRLKYITLVLDGRASPRIVLLYHTVLACRTMDPPVSRFNEHFNDSGPSDDDRTERDPSLDHSAAYGTSGNANHPNPPSQVQANQASHLDPHERDNGDNPGHPHRRDKHETNHAEKEAEALEAVGANRDLAQGTATRKRLERRLKWKLDARFSILVSGQGTAGGSVY